MQATIKYRLSNAGQKASILAGGDGKAEQTFVVPGDDPRFAAVVEQATIGADGRVTLDLTGYDYSCEPSSPTIWDHVPSVAELLADYPARKARKGEIEAAERAERRARTARVLAERKTAERSMSIYQDGIYTQHDWREADWPYYSDPEIRESDEAKAWEAELDAAKATAKAEAQAEADRKSAERKARAEANAVAEAERRASLGLRDGDEDYAIEDGALTQVPCWESHKRGKNWLATIAADPQSPGGLARDFAAKAKGDSYYMVPALTPGQSIEFGSDYYSGSGKPSRKRWYGYVVSIDAERLILHECGTAKAAIKEGVSFAEGVKV